MKNAYSFNKIFYILSFFFILYFYIIPLVIIQSEVLNNISYDLYTTDNNIYLAWTSLCLFVFGFISIDTIKLLFSRKEIIKSKRTRVNKFYYFFLVLYFVLLFYMYFSISLEDIYAIRRGEMQGSWFRYFISLFLQGLKFSILFLMLKKNINKVLIISFLLITIFVAINTGTGRLNLLLDFIILIMVLLNLKANQVAILIVVGLMFLLPILFNLKVIIYMIASDTITFENIIELFSKPFDFDLYINNFGHPVISLLMIDSLIEKIGYHYFYDYIHDFIFYLKIFGIDIDDTITYYNTENLIGEYKSIVPPGYLAYGYIQLGIIGIYFSGIVYRGIGFLGEKIYSMIKLDSEIAKFVIAFLSANSFYHGEIRILIVTLLLNFGIMFIILNISISQKDH